MARNYANDYPADWPKLSLRTKLAAGWRCVRCGHRFNGASQPLACDDRCDLSRGRAVAVAGARALGLARTLRDHYGADGSGLNYGVHHLDGDKANQAWWNLLALCNSCHLSIQAKVMPEVPYLWEHSPWFRPYVAGYYAAQRGHDLPDLLAYPDRDDVERWIVAWLAEGQPWLYPPAAASATTPAPEPVP